MKTWGRPATSSRWVPIFKRRPAVGGEQLVLLALLLLAAGLRLRAIDWGLPALTEEATPFRKAMEFWGADTGRLTLHPHFFNYPSLTFYFHFVLQALYGLFGFVSGAWGSLNEFRTALDQDPVPFIRLARWGTALVATATVVPVYLAGRRLGGVPAGLAAGILLAVNPLHVAQSRIIGTDIPLAFAAAMALLALIDIGLSGRTRDGEAPADPRSLYRRAGIWIGLAASCKYPGALLVLPLLAAHFAPGYFHAAPVAGEGPRFRQPLRLLAGALLAALVAFAVTSPYVILDLPDAIESLSFERHHMTSGHFGGTGGLALITYLSDVLPHAFGWMGLALAALALFLTPFRSGPVRLVALFALAALVVIGSWRTAADRYLLLALPALVLLSGVGLSLGLARFRLRSAALAGLAAILIGAPGIATAWREGTLSGRPTTRAAAERWVLDNVPRKTLVAAEMYSVESLADSLPLLVIPFDAVAPHVYDPAYSLPYYVPFEYVVLSSTQYDRYLSRQEEFAAQAAFYEGMARDRDQVAVFEPGRDLVGPTIRIFRKRPGTERPDFRSISGAFYNDIVAPAPMARFLTHLGAVLSKGGEEELALAAAEHAVSLAPDDPKGLSNMAAMRAMRGDYLTALKTYQRALEISPADPVLHYNLGRLYQGKGLHSEASAAYMRAIRLNPRLAEAYLALATTELESNQSAAGKATLERFLELFPTHPRAEDARRALRELFGS